MEIAHLRSLALAATPSRRPYWNTGVHAGASVVPRSDINLSENCQGFLKVHPFCHCDGWVLFPARSNLITLREDCHNPVKKPGFPLKMGAMSQ